MWPYISQKHFVEDDLIISGDKKTGKFLQKKHIFEKQINITGFVLLCIGFIFQIIGIL